MLGVLAERLVYAGWPCYLCRLAFLALLAGYPFYAGWLCSISNLAMLDCLAVYAVWFSCQCMLAILYSFLAAYGGSAGWIPVGQAGLLWCLD
jgi:hypothetical protein